MGKLKTPNAPPEKWGWARPAAKVLIIIFAAAVLTTTVTFVYGAAFSGRILPGVSLGAVLIGGLTRAEVLETLDGLVREFSLDGVVVQAQKIDGSVEEVRVPVSAAVVYDLEATVNTLMQAGRDHHPLLNGWAAVWTRVFGKRLPAVASVQSAKMRQALPEKLRGFEDPGQNARLVFRGGESVIENEREGWAYDYDQAADLIAAAANNFDPTPVLVVLEPFIPNVTAADVRSLLPAVSAASAASLNFTFTDAGTKKEFNWTVGKDTLRDWIQIVRIDDGSLQLALDRDKAAEFLADIAEEIEVAPTDAKFEIVYVAPSSASSSPPAASAIASPSSERIPKVKVFEPSRDGTALDQEKMMAKLTEAIRRRAQDIASRARDARDVEESGTAEGSSVLEESSIPLEVVTAPAKIKTADANDLGIREALGVGISNFRGSPKNRLKNIRNGVQKLNNVLIAPGQEFSLLAHLKPFTAAGGYLPELVIKGDKIEPDIGGGLCQIGTTMFRSAMKAGMPITERRNHSIVVRYYGDPTNGAPGTDATIYEPSPDFKFMNDIGQYLLLTTEMDMEKSELRFTLWGAGDGRKGDYTAPVVLGWIPAGEDKRVESTELPPGEEKCQEKHNGARAKFTYFVEKPDGTRVEQIYESYYRPMPKTCLVGVTSVATSTSEIPIEQLTQGFIAN